MKIINKFDIMLLFILIFVCSPGGLNAFLLGGILLGIIVLSPMVYSILTNNMPNDGEMRTLKMFCILMGLVVLLIAVWFHKQPEYVDLPLTDCILFALGFGSGVTIGINAINRVRAYLLAQKGN